MDFYEVCQRIVGLHESIFASALLEEGVIRAIRIKSGEQLERQRLDTIMAQFWRGSAFFRESEALFGIMQHLVVHYNNADVMMFSVILNGRQFRLAVFAKHGYVHEELVEKIANYLVDLKAHKT